MRALTTALTALGVLLLAGCGGNPEASPPPTPSATASPSPSASATAAEPPEMPAAAMRPTKQGAAAFVEHYVNLLNFASATGQSKPARDLDDKSCQSCREVFDTIDSVYGAGGEIRGGAWKPTVINTLRSGQGWVVDLRVRFDEQVLVREQGGDEETFTGGEGLLSFIVAKRNGGWVVDEWTRAS